MAAVGFKQFGQPEVLREIGPARRVLLVPVCLLFPFSLSAELRTFLPKRIKTREKQPKLKANFIFTYFYAWTDVVQPLWYSGRERMTYDK